MPDARGTVISVRIVKEGSDDGAGLETANMYFRIDNFEKDMVIKGDHKYRQALRGLVGASLSKPADIYVAWDYEDTDHPVVSFASY